MAALGAGAGYYYNSTQTIKTKTLSTPAAATGKTEKKKNIDYQQVYNDIAEMLDEDSE